MSFIGALGITDVVGVVTTTGRPMGRIIYSAIAMAGQFSYTIPTVWNGFQIAIQDVSSPAKTPYCSLNSLVDVWLVSADRHSFTVVIRSYWGSLSLLYLPIHRHSSYDGRHTFQAGWLYKICGEWDKLALDDVRYTVRQRWWIFSAPLRTRPILWTLGLLMVTFESL
jgi:hypothetical protein